MNPQTPSEATVLEIIVKAVTDLFNDHYFHRAVEAPSPVFVVKRDFTTERKFFAIASVDVPVIPQEPDFAGKAFTTVTLPVWRTLFHCQADKSGTVDYDKRTIDQMITLMRRDLFDAMMHLPVDLERLHQLSFSDCIKLDQHTILRPEFVMS